MIYVRGDTHGDLNCFTEAEMPGESRWTEEDILIVAGDFGFVFYGGDRDEKERQKLDVLAGKPYTILFVDGNHEGFPYLEEYPREERFGGIVSRIRDNVFWLHRGYVYELSGERVFVMGGAYSMDKAFRLQYSEVSGTEIWFEQELPSAEEYRRAIAALKQRNMQVDYIITHTAPRSIIPRVINTIPDLHDAELTGFLDWVYYEVDFRKWYFGHFHEDARITEQMIACCHGVHVLGE